VGVADDLHLEVPAALDVLLDQHRVVTERRGRLALRGGDRLVVVLGGADDAHPLAATAGRRLHQHGIGGVLAGRHHRHAGGDRDLAGRVLATHPLHHLGRRADERDTRGVDRADELGALGQEAVARMDRVRADAGRGSDHRADVEVAPDPHRLVGRAHVGGGLVDVGVHRDGGDPEMAAGAHHPQRDLAAVGDQDLGEDAGHGHAHIRKTP
jgi:hypothetical protein